MFRIIKVLFPNALISAGLILNLSSFLIGWNFLFFPFFLRN
jgi:hypothetical protein